VNHRAGVPADDANTSPAATDESRGRIAAARQRVDRARSAVVDSRTRFRTVDVAFQLSDRDVATGGAVLAGAVAFRMFLWTLPAALVAVGILGFNAGDAQSDASEVGLGEVTAQAVGQAAAQAHRARWVLVVAGTVLLISVSHTLGVTVRTATALTWQQPVRRGSGYLQTALVTAVAMGGVLVLVVLCSWLRKHSPGIGIVVAVAVVLIWTSTWWGISTLLPHPPLPWWGLLPGAALVGVGTEIMHLVVIFYLAPKVTSSAALYGSLGAAATLLLGAYLVSRLMLASSSLNATLHARYRADGGQR
jgi:uncharacterized BrkB/YihY/UPF0761 family membrane protein